MLWQCSAASADPTAKQYSLPQNGSHRTCLLPSPFRRMPAANDSGCAYLLRFSGILKSVADAGLWTSREATCTWRTLSNAAMRMYASGKALVALAISARTWLASLQPNMGSLYIAQYLRQTHKPGQERRPGVLMGHGTAVRRNAEDTGSTLLAQEQMRQHRQCHLAQLALHYTTDNPSH